MSAAQRDAEGAPSPLPHDAGADSLPPALAAVLEVLWPPSDALWVGLGSPPAGYETVERFAPLPDLARPRLLVPLGSARATAASLRQFNQGMSQRARLGKFAAGIALGSPARRYLARESLSVARRGSGGETLVDHLRDALGVEDLTIAIGLGPVRPNMKPVLQLLHRDGRVLGYAKVAWNPLTERLVEHEAAILDRLSEHPPATFDAPRVLLRSTWADRPLILTSPIPHPLLRRGPMNAEVPDDILREISERGGMSSSPLAAHPYWASLRRRVDAVAAPSRRDVLAAALERLERERGAEELDFGSWHGDLAPGNVSVVRGRPRIWDWERSEDGVPVGLDPIHFHYQLVWFRQGKRVSRAVRRGLEAADPALERLGVARSGHRLLATLYLLERFVRYEEARPEGAVGDWEGTIAQLVEAVKEDPS